MSPLFRKYAYWAYKIGGIGLIGIAAFTLLLRLLLPLWAPSQAAIEARLKAHLPYPARIQAVRLSLEGFHPAIVLSQVEILTPENVLALSAHKVKLLLSISHLLEGQVALNELIVEGANVGLEYQEKGQLMISGLPELKMDMSPSSQTMPVNRFVLENSDVHLMLGNERSLPLTQVQMAFQSGRVTKIRGEAIIVGVVPTALEWDLDIPAQSEPLTWYAHAVGENLHWPMALEEGKFDVEIWGTQSLGKAASVIAKFEVEKLHLQNKKEPDFLNMGQAKGTFSAEKLSDQWHIQLQDAAFSDVQFSYNQVAMKIQDLSKVNLMLKAKAAPEWHIQVANLQANIEGTALNGKATLYPIANSFHIDSLFQVGNIGIKKALTFLPRTKMDGDLVKWLDSALLDGNITSSTLVLRGDWNRFPFNHQEGVFELENQCDHVQLNYDVHWPEIKGLTANLLFSGPMLTITAENGTVATGQLRSAKAVIADLTANIPQLVLQGEIASSLKEANQVIQESPLKEKLKTLNNFEWTGDMLLSLGLNIPLSSSPSHPVTAKGVVQVHDASIHSPSLGEVAVTQLEGEVSFYDTEVSSRQLKGMLLNSPANFEIQRVQGEKDSELHVNVSGTVSSEKVFQELKSNKPSFISGATDYQAKFIIPAIKTDPTILQITSSLKGIQILAPLPFNKQPGEVAPFLLELYLDTNNFIHIDGKYRDVFQVVTQLHHQDKRWQALRAHLHFGKTNMMPFQEDKVVLIDGTLPQLDISQWQTFLNENGVGDTSSSQLKPVLNCHAQDLIFFNEHFSNIDIEAKKENETTWNIYLKSPALQGKIRFPDEGNELNVNLDKLILAKNDSSLDLSSDKKISSFRHPIQIAVKDFKFEKKALTDLSARLEPISDGYRLKYAKAKMKGGELNLAGSWHYSGNAKSTELNGKVLITNIGDALKSLDIQSSLKGAKGDTTFSLEWQGSPFNIQKETMIGQLTMGLYHGYIVGINSGMGTILNFLSLESVRRRLRLDFNDVKKNQFAFDELTGKFQFGKGKVSSNNLFMKGPSANIRAVGQADLVKETLEGEMTVMPNMTGSLPVATAIAIGNPAIGAAVWAVDKVTRSQIQQISRFRYRVVGPWQSPKLQPINSRNNKGEQ